jgi:predicted MFS family arabinose efflux permease
LVGPFRWVVAAYGLETLAFFAFYGTVFVQAAYDHDAGPSQTAVLGIALSVPFILGSLLQGLVVDRWSPKWLSFIGYAVGASAIPIAWTGDSLGSLYVSAFLVGASFATIEPARSSLTALLMRDEDLVRANGLMAISFQTALTVGSLGGAALLDAFGPRSVYAVAFVVALLPLPCLLFVPDVRQRGEVPGLSLAELRAGAKTAWHLPSLRLLLLVTGLGWALVNTFFVLEPIFVREVLGREESSLLYLWFAHGMGAIVGAVILGRARWTREREPVLVCAGTAAIGTGIFIYAAAGSYPVAFAAGAVQGAGFSFFFPPLFAFIQRVVTEDQRGRVTSVFVALQEGMGLLSSLVILALDSLIVVRPTLVASGAVLGAMGLLGLRTAAVAAGSAARRTARKSTREGALETADDRAPA